MQNGSNKIQIFNVGSCKGYGKIAQKSLPWKKVEFLARVFVVETSNHGLILIDTGYGSTFFEKPLSFSKFLYRTILPINFVSSDSLFFQLKKVNIKIEDISYILITHFHVDHIAGLKEFRNVPWIYRQDALSSLKNMSIYKRLKNGFFSDLIPKVPKGSVPVIASDFSFDIFRPLQSFDLFGDKNLYLLNLPGHAIGQMGLYWKEENTLFVGDAIWSVEAIKGTILPNSLGLHVQHNKRDYIETFTTICKLANKDPYLKIVPMHTIRRIY